MHFKTSIALVLAITLNAAAQSTDPLNAVYAALQNTSPAPQLLSAPENLANSCDAASLGRAYEETYFDSGIVHHMLGSSFAWHSFVQSDGSVRYLICRPAARCAR
jgi:hypothetical protein